MKGYIVQPMVAADRPPMWVVLPVDQHTAIRVYVDAGQGYGHSVPLMIREDCMMIHRAEVTPDYHDVMCAAYQVPTQP